jgi:glycosyltransferase involved in cell wall biosynthesis
MRIAYILPSLAQKGPIIVVYDLINYLVKKKEIKDITVFYFDNKVELNFLCKVQKINFKEDIPFQNYDIIHSHMLRPDLYIFTKKILGKIKKSKLITTLHQYNYENLSYYLNSKVKAYVFSKFWNIILLSFDKVVCLSEDMKTYYKKQFIPSKKLEVIYNGRPIPDIENDNDSIIEIELFKRLKNKNSIILGTSCLITKRKGLEQVIKVMPQFPNLQFVVIGSGPEENTLKELARSLNVEDRCWFLGFKKNPIQYYKYFDIFILPSRSEGFPLSVIEAISMQKAVIVSNLNIMKEAFSENEVVFFELDNLSDLKDKILFAYKNKKLFEFNAFKAYQSKYTSEIMAESYLNLYVKILKAK